MRRAVGHVLILAAAALVWTGIAAAAAPADRELVRRASARGAAVHGFYDHEGLFPVALLNVSVPYTEASIEPGPSSSALGSFLWDPEAAQLGAILCQLSDGSFCQFPDYPFQATASHPSAGETEPPPQLTIDDPSSPVAVRAAHERARAGARQASAEAGVAALLAVPMSESQAAAVGTLAAALTPVAGPVSAGEWLVSVELAESESSVETAERSVRAASISRVQSLELLGGMVTARGVRGRAVAAVTGSGGQGRARSAAAEIRVAGLAAEIGPRGLRVNDRRLGRAELEGVNRAVGAALEDVGLALGPGLERVRRSSSSARAETYAFSVDFRRELFPDQLPEGTGGADVLRVPLGFAAAEAERTVLRTAPPASAGVLPQHAAPQERPAPSSVGGESAPIEPAPPPGPLAAEPPPPLPEVVAAEPRSRILDLGVPLRAVLLVSAGAVSLMVGLSWLKVNEALTE